MKQTAHIQLDKSYYVYSNEMFAGNPAVRVGSLAQNTIPMGISECNKEPSAIMTFVILKVLECDRSAKSIFPPQKPAKYLLYCADKDYLYVKENSSPLVITVIIFKPTCTVEPLFNEDLVPIRVKYIGKKNRCDKASL